MMDERWERWHTCGLCEQEYHGVVVHALGWACWKTYVGRPETDKTRRGDEPAWERFGRCRPSRGRIVRGEAELAMARRLGASENNMLVMQGNLANTYRALGRFEQAPVNAARRILWNV